MIISPGRSSGLPSGRRGPTFTGPVWADPVLPATDDVTINSVFFPPGARTFWHQQERGQILRALAGSGLICAAGQRPRVLRPGDVVWVPPLERPWHGAAPQSFMTRLAVSPGRAMWAGEVAEADYSAIPDE